MIVAGIDYSMTCPGVCIYNTDKDLQFKNCDHFFMAPSKKYQSTFLSGCITGFTIQNWQTNQQRFDYLSEKVISLLLQNEVQQVFIEGYSFGSKGAALFQIAENTGLLKHKMMKSRIDFQTVAPSEVKKFFTGKGNANKDLMYESFVEKTGLDVRSDLDYSKKTLGSPVADIVDAYAIMLCGSQRLGII